MSEEGRYTNALIHSESPYLKQHAHNPVNWEPWSDEIWEKAAAENKLVIVSIGYSTCHWCHVMERESFENEETAGYMNENFLCIKVDREERPDIDMVYMDACQLITGRGGWPLNAFCLPDKTPVYAGTYFPTDAWNSMLTQLSTLWKTEPQKLTDYAEKMKQGLQQMNLAEFPQQQKTGKKDLSDSIEKLKSQLDFEYGGLKRTQKFPMPSVLELLLDDYLISGDETIADFIHLTLLHMANGGIYDQIRGGFCRYSVDPYWFAPHFEKMLYDNAQLISVYARASAIFDADIYKNIAVNTIAFCNRELSDHQGYFSALDADSEGVEGKFYVFQYSELRALLSPAELQFAENAFGVSEKGNWEHGYNIIHVANAPLKVLEELKITAPEFHALKNSVTVKLFEHQNTRIRPGLDNKKICSWNALMLKALTDAAKYLHSDYTKEAERQARWMLQHFYLNKKLLRISQKNNKNVSAFAEDFAACISAFVSLYELTGNAEWLPYIEDFCTQALENFYDAEKSVMYFTSQKDEAILLRKTDFSDDVIPSAGSMLCMALKKAAILLSRNDFTSIAAEMLGIIRAQALEQPAWYSNWCRNLQAEALGFIQLIYSGNADETAIREFKKSVPEWALILDMQHSDVSSVKEKMSRPEHWFVCIDQTCLEPLSDAEKAAEILRDILH